MTQYNNGILQMVLSTVKKRGRQGMEPVCLSIYTYRKTKQIFLVITTSLI